MGTSYNSGGGKTTAAAIESTFTAAAQLYVGTGALTGVLSSTTVGDASLNSLGIGTAPTGTNGRISVANGGTIQNVSINCQITLANSGVLSLYGAGGVNIGNNANFTAGMSDAAHASVSNPVPVSGTPFTPNTSFLSFVLVNAEAATAGTVAITMGPTTGEEKTVCSATNLLIGSGQTIGFPVPNGWKVVVTTTGTVTLSSSVTVL
jgi:hypothetical protein